MTVVVNGEEREVSPELTVKALLGELGLDRDGVAVAVDRRVVPRSRHAQTRLEPGAQIEIIRAVGGG
jgi:sulfur carrier protein